jgi:hypothetical protein
MHLLALALALLAAAAFWPRPVDERPQGFPAKPLGSFRTFERIVVIGLPLSGKTTLAAKLTKGCPRVVYIDPENDYAALTGAVEIPADALLADPGILDKPTFRYAITFGEGEPPDYIADLTRIIRAAGDLVLVYDEVGDYNEGHAGATLKRMARTGRHDGIVSIYVSQVAVDIPKTVRRLATTVYSFRQVHPHDLKALSEVYGETFADKVAHAGEHEVSKWTLTLDHTAPLQTSAQPRVG